MDKKNDKVVGLGFYKTKPVGLGEYLSRRESKLNYFESEIERLKNDINIADTTEKRKHAESELLDLEKKYNELKYNDEKYNTYKKNGSYNIDKVGIYFQDEDEHIIENVKRVLTTRPGERIGNIYFGSNVSKYLFMPEMSVDDIIQEIVNSLRRWEPRVRVLECTLTATKWDTVEIDLTIQVIRTEKILNTKIEL